jgi:hypothetical protein
MKHRFSNIGIFTALALLVSNPAFADNGVKINELVVAASIPNTQRDTTVKAASLHWLTSSAAQSCQEGS